MKKHLNFLIFTSIFITLTACGTSKKDATYYIEQARMLETDQPQSALLMTDSVHLLFPRDIASRRQADTIEWNIELKLAEKSILFVDSMSNVLEDSLTRLTPKFKYIKDERYQDVGCFEHKILTTERNTERNYLKPTVSENGKAEVVSFFIGQKSGHHSISLMSDSVSITIEPETQEDIHSFDNNGRIHETIHFKNANAIKLLQFIDENKENKLRITLNGNGGYIYYLTQTEKDVIADCHTLAITLADYNEFNKQSVQLTQKIARLRHKLNRE